MTNDDFSEISQGLERISRQREQIRQSPIVLGVREIVRDINERALNGLGSPSLIGVDFEDLTFNLEWEGEHTKMREDKELFNITVKIAPFNLTIKPVRVEGEDWLRFKITANYTGEEEDIIEVGITDRLDPEQIRPILEAQIDAIRESARK